MELKKRIHNYFNLTPEEKDEVLVEIVLPVTLLPVTLLVDTDPGIVSLVPANMVLPPLYLGLVVRAGLAFLIAATVVPFALAIELSV